MLLLNDTSDIIRLTVTGTIQLDSNVSYSDVDPTSGPPVSIDVFGAGEAVTASPTTIVDAPTGAFKRNVKEIHLHNTHASGTANVTVEFFNGTTAFRLWKGNILAGESLHYVEGVGFQLFDTAGLIKGTGNDTFRLPGSTADQVIGASVTSYLTGSAINLSSLYKPISVGTQIKWEIMLSKSAAATVSMTFDMRFGTAGTTADTSRANMATGTQTGVADVGRLVVQATVRTLSATGVIHAGWALEHNLAATGLGPTPNIVVQSTSGTFDLTVAQLIAGLSLTTGALHSITIHAINPQVDIP